MRWVILNLTNGNYWRQRKTHIHQDKESLRGAAARVNWGLHPRSSISFSQRTFFLISGKEKKTWPATHWMKRPRIFTIKRSCYGKWSSIYHMSLFWRNLQSISGRLIENTLLGHLRFLRSDSAFFGAVVGSLRFVVSSTFISMRLSTRLQLAS